MTPSVLKSPAISQWTTDQYIAGTHIKKKNLLVYRLYKINPLCFWRWSHYLITSRDCDYKSCKEIEPNRVPYPPENKYQDF